MPRCCSLRGKKNCHVMNFAFGARARIFPCNRSDPATCHRSGFLNLARACSYPQCAGPYLLSHIHVRSSFLQTKHNLDMLNAFFFVSRGFVLLQCLRI